RGKETSDFKSPAGWGDFESKLFRFSFPSTHTGTKAVEYTPENQALFWLGVDQNGELEKLVGLNGEEYYFLGYGTEYTDANRCQEVRNDAAYTMIKEVPLVMHRDGGGKHEDMTNF